MRVFVDASVLFSAIYSPNGAARDLLQLATEDKVTLIISQNILEEIARNILKKAPHLTETYQDLLETANLETMSAPPQEAVDRAATYVATKDAHVVAAAIIAAPDYLATYDRKHLLDIPLVAEKSGLAITTPDTIVQLMKE